MFGRDGIVMRMSNVAASLASNENISSSVWSRKSVSVRILRTTGNVKSFVSTRYAPALPDSKADMKAIESSSQSAGTRERSAKAMIFDANSSDCAYVLVVG